MVVISKMPGIPMSCIKLFYWSLADYSWPVMMHVSISFHMGELTVEEQSGWWIWAKWLEVESHPLRKECSCRRQSCWARNNETKYGPVFGRLDRSSYSCWFFLSLFPQNLLCSAFGLCIWLCPSTHLHAASKNQTKTTRKYFCIRNF